MNKRELKKMELKAEKLKQLILTLIPTKKVSKNTIIIAFEKIEIATKRSKKIDLFDLSEYLYRTKDVDFDKINRFFKNVHSAIRELTVKSKFYDGCLEYVALANYREDTGFYFGKKQYEKAYNETLDFYDPNKTQNKSNYHFNWSGFWSLIETKKGKITGCFLSDTMDRELFYEALK